MIHGLYDSPYIEHFFRFIISSKISNLPDLQTDFLISVYYQKVLYK